MAKRVKEIAGIELFREPDEVGPDYAVWYGPGGPEGDVATVATLSGIMGEVQYVADVIEEPEADFLVTSTSVDLAKEVSDHFKDEEDPEEEAEDLLESLDDTEKMRMIASIGADHIPRYGGDEEWAETLQGGIDTLI